MRFEHIEKDIVREAEALMQNDDKIKDKVSAIHSILMDVISGVCEVMREVREYERNHG